MKSLLVIGLGNMGSAIFEMLSKNKNVKVLGCEKEDDINKKLALVDSFIIAIKPQDFEDLCKSIKIDLSKKLVISIMAGISTDRIRRGLKAKKIVRVMPNLALKTGKSLSGWFANKEVSNDDKKFIKAMLEVFGEEVEVNKEDKINMITSLSGSGPAYFYRLTEIIKNKAKKMGFSEGEARKIADTTFLGAASVLEKTGLDSEELRRKVTSKKGTTEAALNSMKKSGLEKIINKGIDKAYKRAKELNK